MSSIRKALLEAKKKENKNTKNTKMLKKLHALDETIDQFIDELEDEISAVKDNPTFVKKCSQLLVNLSKEHSEFTIALRAVVNAVDRKSKLVPMFKKMESPVRDVRNGIGDEQGQEQATEE